MLLPIILRPICGEDSSIGIHSIEGRSPWHWDHHAHRSHIDSGLIEKIGSASEYPDVVLVKAEHNAEVDRDSVTMQTDNRRLFASVGTKSPYPSVVIVTTLK
jgi:hypothetical protein